jgi:hypothetical protein
MLRRHGLLFRALATTIILCNGVHASSGIVPQVCSIQSNRKVF